MSRHSSGDGFNEMPEVILLFQDSHNLNSRTYFHFSSFQGCLEGILNLFENNLRQLHPDEDSVTYSLNQLFLFIEHVPYLMCLVKYHSAGGLTYFPAAYIPYSRRGLQDEIFNMLIQQSAKWPALHAAKRPAWQAKRIPSWNTSKLPTRHAGQLLA